MKPVISVIIPVYNVEKFVKKCLESILAQEYKNLDIVVVDDGATDESGSICDEFAKKDKRVRVFHKRNGGLSDARNFGIKKAKGEIIAFVDSDDFVDKKYISDMYAAMKKEDADIVVCGYNNAVLKEQILSGKEATIKLLVRQENIEIVAWNKLYKKTLFVNNDIYFPIGLKHEDTLMTYKILSKAQKVAYVSESLYDYVEREGSITETEDVVERLNARETAVKEAIEFFKNNLELKQAAEVSLLLAKYAYLDAAINGRIDWRYGEAAKKWIKKQKSEFQNNKYMTKKLKIYNLMSTKFGGAAYRVFRKIVHE